jgi:hypothetical protein
MLTWNLDGAIARFRPVSGRRVPAGQAAGLGGGDLQGEQPFQRGGQRQAIGGGGVEDGGRCS